MRASRLHTEIYFEEDAARPGHARYGGDSAAYRALLLGHFRARLLFYAAATMDARLSRDTHFTHSRWRLLPMTLRSLHFAVT